MTLVIVQASESNGVTFSLQKEGSKEHAVVASELALCCHNVRHSLSSPPPPIGSTTLVGPGRLSDS
jgi:hypothetical protein